MIRGFGDMLPTLTMLLVTFVLKDLSGKMGMTEYIIQLAEPFLFAAVFPAMVFILGAVLAFTTGSDWGMSSIITPLYFRWVRPWGKSGSDHGSSHFRRNIRKPCMLLFRCNVTWQHSQQAWTVWNML